MKTLRRLLILFVMAGAMAGLIVLIHHMQRRQAAQPNPYEYNVDAFKKVDPALIKYEQAGEISLGITNLHAIAVDRQDRIVAVADGVILLIEKDGKSLSRHDLEGSPTCVAVDSNDDIYLGMKDHIEVMDHGGAVKARWEKPDIDVFLTSIALTGDSVFAADFAARIVWRYGRNGKLLGRIGDKDDTKGIPGFIVPSPHFDVAAASDGTIWVTSPGRQRIEHYTMDGKLLGFWGQAGMEIDGFCGCCNPTDIAFLPDGAFVTTEKGLARAKVYEQDGKFRCVVAAPDRFAEDTVGMDVAVDSTGRVLVLDPKAGSVRVFVKKG